jgi:hypothetical protein
MAAAARASRYGVKGRPPRHCWSLFFVKVCPFLHTRNCLCERRDGAPQAPQGTVASNPSVFRVAADAVVVLSAGFLPT